jgi:myo-inositol 2-dehydrogenase/D-chiro-inositol 1-dehydrogenase
VKVALIGAGAAGEGHARVLAEAVDGLVIYDENLLRAHDLARQLGGVVAKDAFDALARVDAVVIATPAESHAALVWAAVDRSRPVLCEKPLATSVAEAVQLAEHATRRGVLVEVGFQRRFDAEYVAAQRAIRHGCIGRLHLLRVHSAERGRAPSPKTNLLQNTAIHDFDVVRWLSGDEVVSVYVEGSDRSTTVFDPRLDPDTIVATMRLARGALAVATVTRLSTRGYDVRTEVLGDRDCVSIGWSDRTPVRSLELGWAGSTAVPWDSWRTRFAPAFREEVTAFLAAVDGAAPRGASVADAVAAQRIAEAARRSMQQGGPVRLEVKSQRVV